MSLVLLHVFDEEILSTLVKYVEVCVCIIYYMYSNKNFQYLVAKFETTVTKFVITVIKFFLNKICYIKVVIEFDFKKIFYKRHNTYEYHTIQNNTIIIKSVLQNLLSLPKNLSVQNIFTSVKNFISQNLLPNHKICNKIICFILVTNFLTTL